MHACRHAFSCTPLCVSARSVPTSRPWLHVHIASTSHVPTSHEHCQHRRSSQNTISPSFVADGWREVPADR
eukprot:365986-Chlamydomonas_euryale.AAC.4